MVRKGTRTSPDRRRRAAASSLLATVRSENGTPRLVRKLRALLQGPQPSPVYSVTGYLLETVRSSKGRPPAALPPPAGMATVGASCGLACLSTGGLSEKV